MVTFSKNFSDWNKLALEELKLGSNSKPLSWKSEEGIDIKALYTKEDLEGLEHLDTMPDSHLLLGVLKLLCHGRPDN